MFSLLVFLKHSEILLSQAIWLVPGKKFKSNKYLHKENDKTVVILKIFSEHLSFNPRNSIVDRLRVSCNFGLQWTVQLVFLRDHNTNLNGDCFTICLLPRKKYFASSSHPQNKTRSNSNEKPTNITATTKISSVCLLFKKSQINLVRYLLNFSNSLFASWE